MQDITNRILRQMNSTRLISTLFKPRQKATALYATQAEALQHKVFCRLMKDAAHTEWGLKYGYKDIKSKIERRLRCLYCKIRADQRQEKCPPVR